MLETLSIIAYRRQVTRPEIEQLRGVDTGGVLETLLERALIRIAGRKDAPGRPIFYETTPGFLELFGLKNLEELPDLEEFRAIEGTLADTLASSGEQPEMAKDDFGTSNDAASEVSREAEREPPHESDGSAADEAVATLPAAPEDHKS